MDVYSTNNNNSYIDQLLEAYPEFHFVYPLVICFSTLSVISIIMCVFPLPCLVGLTILLAVSRLFLKRRHLTFFNEEYDLDVFPEELPQI
jgi:hypothetical protein